MIDEKKLIDWIKCHCNPYCKPDLGLDTSLKIIDFIENQMTKIEKCADCSRRKFYQEGYRDGVKNNVGKLSNYINQPNVEINGRKFVDEKLMLELLESRILEERNEAESEDERNAYDYVRNIIANWSDE